MRICMIGMIVSVLFFGSSTIFCSGSDGVLTSDKFGRTQLHTLVSIGSIKQVEKLLSEYGENKEFVNATDKRGMTAMDCIDNSFLQDDPLLQIDLLNLLKSYGGITGYEQLRKKK